LLVVAARRELEAVLRAIDPGFDIEHNLPEQWALCPCGVVDVVLTGVGKASASGGVGRVLDPARHLGVLSVGIAGAIKETTELPGCDVLDVVCADSSAFADEGVETADAFISCAQLGFAPFDVLGDGSDSLIHNQGVIEWLAGFSDHVGPIACVSVCSGTDGLAQRVSVRTGAIAEAMEGAAVCLAAHRIDPGLLTGELRVISNLTGDRENQQWDLDGALDKLTRVLGRVIDTLR
tara:strand:+ start:136895 stop:137599 length:705 start_codon:yes stop_codon:yes gene_type:complete